MKCRVSCAIAMLAVAATSTVRGQDRDDDGERGPGNASHNLRVYLDEHPVTESPTGNWFGLGDDLQDLGITTTLNLWMTYQANVSGGLTTGDDFNGQYWFGTHFDFDRMLGLTGGSAYLQVEGGWSDGINADVGALMTVNGMVSEDPIGVAILWYEQALLDDRLRFRLGKIDVTTEAFRFHGRAVAFDAMPYANSPRTQFLDTGLVNNAAVPFPTAGLTAMMLVEPVQRWYVAAAGYDRNPHRFGTNRSRAFDDWMISVETGVAVTLGDAVLEGHYYAGYWYSTFPGAPDGQGAYLGVAQQLYRESDADSQGLGLFARYGYGHRNPDGVDHFWSLGAQYTGLFPRLDGDVLAVGWAQAFTTGGFAAPYEGALELYYRARVSPWLHLSPHLQYVVNPGSGDIADAVTLGVRGQITF